MAESLFEEVNPNGNI